MSRSGYSDDCDDTKELNLYRGRVKRAIQGKRGQKFLRELAAAMDAMPEKVLIAHELISEDGDCCTIGVVCKARGLDVSGVDIEDGELVGKLVGIAPCMAREIEFENDEEVCWRLSTETPEQRWQRMRKWVERHIIEAKPEGVR
jgi:hypothetical protein